MNEIRASWGRRIAAFATEQLVLLWLTFPVVAGTAALLSRDAFAAYDTRAMYVVMAAVVLAVYLPANRIATIVADAVRAGPASRPRS